VSGRIRPGESARRPPGMHRCREGAGRAWDHPYRTLRMGSPLSYPSPGITPIVPFITSRIHHTSVENNTGTFTEVLRELKAHRKEERWKTYNTWTRSCCCPDCPSYNECASRGQELLYCILGMSNSCIRDDRHCTCRECPFTHSSA